MPAPGEMHMEERNQPIIIKKVKKKHGGHHGGSWKVAYADFVTAMMAFFLLLWLITMVSPEKRLAVSEYFKHFNVFREQSVSGVSVMKFSDKTMDVRGMGNKPTSRETVESNLTPEDLMKRLKNAIDEKLKGIRDQILVDIVEGGVRIQIVDMEGREMFPSGGTELTARAKDILRLVAENIRDIPNRVAIEGHTDAAPFHGGQTTNWELSSSRASAARRELENNALEPGRIARVVGYADQELYIKLNPRDPRNRRISIILLTPNA